MPNTVVYELRVNIIEKGAYIYSPHIYNYSLYVIAYVLRNREFPIGGGIRKMCIYTSGADYRAHTHGCAHTETVRAHTHGARTHERDRNAPCTVSCEKGVLAAGNLKGAVGGESCPLVGLLIDVVLPNGLAAALCQADIITCHHLGCARYTARSARFHAWRY